MNKKGAERLSFHMRLSSVVMTAVAALELAADSSGLEERGVHVGVDPAGADRADDLIELPGVNSLAGGGEHLGGGDRPGHGAVRGGAERREGGNRRRGGSAPRLAGPDHDGPATAAPAPL